LVRLMRASYGDSYEQRWLYDPVAIGERVSDGTMVSAVATDAGTIVGHLSIDLASAQDKVGESAHATVDPSERGRYIFERLKTFLAAQARDEGLLGLYSEATAAHPFSQAGNLALGAHEMGYLLGYIPSGVSYSDIETGEKSHRLSVAIMYLKTNDEPGREVHVPEAFADTVTSIYSNAGLSRDVGSAAATPTGDTRMTVEPHPDHNEILLRLWSIGPDAAEVVGERLSRAIDEGVDCVHLGLPLDPETVALGDRFADLGFFFGCVVPEFRPDGDALRLQYLNGVDPHPHDIATASDFGRALLERILADAPSPEGS